MNPMLGACRNKVCRALIQCPLEIREFIMISKFIQTSKTIAVITTMLLVGFSTTVNAGGHKSAGPGDIVEVAAANGSFNTLVDAVIAAGLVDALKGDGPLTVFAPTDDAFAALPAGTLDSLLKPENKEQLKAILLYHVVSGKVMSTDLKGTVNADTLEGSTVEIIVNDAWSKKRKKITVNGANVVAADVAASNGVIHVIDAVLLPPAK
jgi:uncharacterized surface protein with fasciclin (FAS1) repeats